jgi:hypothetical protein
MYVPRVKQERFDAKARKIEIEDQKIRPDLYCRISADPITIGGDSVSI